MPGFYIVISAPCAVFEMTTDSWGSPKNIGHPPEQIFSGTIMAIIAYFILKDLLAIIATCSYLTNLD